MATDAQLTRAERAKFFDGMVEHIGGIYDRAESDLIDLTSDLESITPKTRRRLTTIRRQVTVIREKLDTAYTKWAANGADKSYTYGVDLADRVMLEQGIKTSQAFTRVHQQAIISIAADMALQMQGENRSIDRVFNRAIRLTQQKLVTEAAISKRIAEGLVKGEARRAVSTRILDDLLEQMGDGKFIEINGRDSRPGPYSRLVARTRTREATTEGIVSTVVLNGQDLVQFSYHATSCPVCSPYERKIFSISGTSEDFPPLEQRPPIHPQCGHVLTPYNEEVAEERGELDDDIAESNEPIDEPTNEELREYEKERLARLEKE